MSQRGRFSVLAFTLTALFILSPDSANAQPAQRSPVVVKKVDGGRVKTPEYSVKSTPSSPGTAKDWFRVYVEYDTEPEWLDELNFTFYVLVKGKTTDAPPATLFKGEVAYIHIPAGKRHIADMFIHPNIIARYGDVVQVAVEVRQGGRLLAQTGKPEPKAAWWNEYAPVADVLLNRGQTPFSLINIDDYEIIKPK